MFILVLFTVIGEIIEKKFDIWHNIDDIKQWENAKKKINKKKTTKKNNKTKSKKKKHQQNLERTPIWEYHEIGPWLEIMTSVDADLRSERRLETGRRSESYHMCQTISIS